MTSLLHFFSQQTALHYSARNGHVETCRLLVASKVDVTQRSRCWQPFLLSPWCTHSLRCSIGKTALELAIDYNRADSASYLRSINDAAASCNVAAQLPTAAATAKQKLPPASKLQPSSRPASAAVLSAPCVAGGGARHPKAGPGSKSVASSLVAFSAPAPPATSSLPRPATAPLPKHAPILAAASIGKRKLPSSAAAPANLVSAPAAAPRATTAVSVFQSRAAAPSPSPRPHQPKAPTAQGGGGVPLIVPSSSSSSPTIFTRTTKPAAAAISLKSSVSASQKNGPKQPSQPAAAAAAPAAAAAAALRHPVSTVTLGAAPPLAPDLAAALELLQLHQSQLRAVASLCSSTIAAASPRAKDTPQLQLARAILAVLQQ
jgi:hypothetical protein